MEPWPVGGGGGGAVRSGSKASCLGAMLPVWPGWDRSILKNVPCILEKNAYSAAVEWKVLYMFVRYIWRLVIIDYISYYRKR